MWPGLADVGLAFGVRDTLPVVPETRLGLADFSLLADFGLASESLLTRSGLVDVVGLVGGVTDSPTALEVLETSLEVADF